MKQIYIKPEMDCISIESEGLMVTASSGNSSFIPVGGIGEADMPAIREIESIWED